MRKAIDGIKREDLNDIIFIIKSYREASKTLDNVLILEKLRESSDKINKNVLDVVRGDSRNLNSTANELFKNMSLKYKELIAAEINVTAEINYPDFIKSSIDFDKRLYLNEKEGIIYQDAITDTKTIVFDFKNCVEDIDKLDGLEENLDEIIKKTWELVEKNIITVFKIIELVKSKINTFVDNKVIEYSSSDNAYERSLAARFKQNYVYQILPTASIDNCLVDLAYYQKEDIESIRSSVTRIDRSFFPIRTKIVPNLETVAEEIVKITMKKILDYDKSKFMDINVGKIDQFMNFFILQLEKLNIPKDILKLVSFNVDPTFVSNKKTGEYYDCTKRLISLNFAPIGSGYNASKGLLDIHKNIISGHAVNNYMLVFDDIPNPRFEFELGTKFYNKLVSTFEFEGKEIKIFQIANGKKNVFVYENGIKISGRRVKKYLTIAGFCNRRRYLKYIKTE